VNAVVKVIPAGADETTVLSSKETETDSFTVPDGHAENPDPVTVT
jgi:hypothetical protein